MRCSSRRKTSHTLLPACIAAAAALLLLLLLTTIQYYWYYYCTTQLHHSALSIQGSQPQSISINHTQHSTNTPETPCTTTSDDTHRRRQRSRPPSRNSDVPRIFKRLLHNRNASDQRISTSLQQLRPHAISRVRVHHRSLTW